MDLTLSPRIRPSYLSLRWKSLIALGLVLAIVNASLALIANLQLAKQFELQQGSVREQQARQLRALVDERNIQMSKLASLVPHLSHSNTASGLENRLIRAIQDHGVLLDLEWDVRSVHWVKPDGTIGLSWPPGTQQIPETFLRRLANDPEDSVATFPCTSECRQYLATPLLSDGVYAGNLVLGSSMADALLSFNGLTGAEVALTLSGSETGAIAQQPPEASFRPFPVVTHPDKTIPVLHVAAELDSDLSAAREPILVQQGNHWFEVFRIAALVPGIDALIVNDVSAQRATIRSGTFGSVLLGLLGLLLSMTLLMLIMRGPLRRLRELAMVLPLLAENRYNDLRSKLPRRNLHVSPSDEIDIVTMTVSELTDRMEGLQQDREQAETRLVWLANHDPLTQLFNRRRFNEEFKGIIERAVRFDHEGALLFLDLDQFKDINDLSGHQVGDALLQRVAEQLHTVTLPSDVLARLGGDEFALVLPEGSREDAYACAKAIQEALDVIILQEQGRRHRISASIGIVMFPSQGDRIDQLMANADLAMYQAKEKGRGRSYLYSEEDQGKEQLDARVLWREEIAQALKEDWFDLYGQPIVEIANDRLSHMEILLRMRKPKGEIVYPDRFIPIAERTGQIHAIDHWVVDRALTMMAQRPDLRVSINLSGGAMDDPTLLDQLRERIANCGVAPERIAFEVTETAAINSLNNATRLMRGMQELGCRFALDDFGSGYASYAYLRKLPVDDVKIDGSFIRDLAGNREDRIFVKAMTDMVHGMGKRVIAEYVETAEILAILRDMGVDYAQGYYFAKPQPLAQLATSSRAAS